MLCDLRTTDGKYSSMTLDLDHISAWQYDLPEDLIASRPTARRDDSRLMVVIRKTGEIQHRRICELPSLLTANSRLVFNNTKVVPARLLGFRTETKGKWEGLFLAAQPDGRWLITGKTRGKLAVGEKLTVIPAAMQSNENPNGGSELTLRLDEKQDQGTWLVSPEDSRSAFEILEQFGTLPLPPYMGRQVADADDAERYQTVYASAPGAIAAPTAGLHFTDQLLAECRERSIHSTEVTLHVGIGTFRPVNTEQLSEHHMHSEWCEVTTTAASQIMASRDESNKIVAVGTTSVRTLEAAASDGRLSDWDGSTELFIKPGFQFQIVDQLLTNFHLPGSTLIVLVAALAGYELTMEAYAKAVEQKYRFYSYGDAMLIL